MNKKILAALIFVMFAGLMYSANAQNVGSAFASNIQSGALGGAIADLLKNTVLLPYTTVGGELDPQYQTQRQIIDGILFFVIFYFFVNTGLKTMWRDAIKGQRIGTAIAISLVLDLALVGSGFSLGAIVPYGKGMVLIALAVGIFFLLQIPKTKDGKPRVNIIAAVVLAIVISWLLLNSLNLFQGTTPTLFGGLFNTERKSDFSARIISGEGFAADPETNYKLALASVQQYDYDKAKDFFVKVIDFGPANNKRYFDAVKWLSRKQGDKLFIHMAEHYPPIMDGERAAAESLIRKAITLNANDPNRKLLLVKARSYLNDVKKKETLLEEEFKIRQ